MTVNDSRLSLSVVGNEALCVGVVSDDGRAFFPPVILFQTGASTKASSTAKASDPVSGSVVAVEPLPRRKEAKTTRGAKVRLDGESRGRTAVTNNGGKNSPLACNPRSNKRRQVSLCEHGCFLWFQFGPVVVEWGLQAQHDTLRP